MSLVNNGYFHADSAIVRQSVAEVFVSIAAQAEVTQSQCAAVKLKLQPSKHEELSHHEAGTILNIMIVECDLNSSRLQSPLMA